MPDFGDTKRGYGKLWDSAVISQGVQTQVKPYVEKAKINRHIYEKVAETVHCPWFMVAAIHMRESGMNFRGHLHNGEPLTDRTKRLVPKGRPKVGNPPFTFSESAIDALSVSPHDLRSVGQWSLERVLYELEKYNGWGYLGKTNSPYLWARTSEYVAGKYIGDGVYSSTHVDRQLGCVAFLKALEMVDEETKAWIKTHRSTIVPKDVMDQEQKKGAKRGQVVTSTGTVVAGTGLFPSKPVIVYTGLGIGLAILTVGIFLWIKGRDAAKESIEARW